MNHSQDDGILEVAKLAARRGGAILKRYFEQGVEIRNKAADGGKSYDLVSDADLESERAVASVLRDAFPNHELLGEEDLDGDAGADHLWIIDPLDGTNNFAHRIPHFAVSIGYFENSRPVAGVVYNPIREDMFWATRGCGAFQSGVSNSGAPTRLSVDPADSLDQVLIGCGFYYDRGDVMRRTLAAIEELFGHDIHGIRRFGTASLDLVMVASGCVGGFFEYQLSPWDFAAGQIILEEAGGKLTNAYGEAIPVATTSMVAANPKLHAILLDIVGRHAPTR
ncbi:MAG: inositol monophosphatase family protein [Planctomycetota bacterium]